jgi:hypothetical protein
VTLSMLLISRSARRVDFGVSGISSSLVEEFVEALIIVLE